MAEQVRAWPVPCHFRLIESSPFPVRRLSFGEDRSCDLLAWDGFPGEEPKNIGLIGHVGDVAQ